MIDVLLVYPPIKDYTKTRFIQPANGSLQIEPPLGLCYIAAVLEQNNYRVRILDMDILKLNMKDFIKYLHYYNPAIVGFSANSLTFKFSLDYAHATKNYSKNIHTIFGGIHPTLFPFETIKNDYVDYVIIGEGEYTTLELVQNLLEHQNQFEKINGLVFKTSNQKIIQNHPRKLEENLDNFPFPAKHLIIGKPFDRYCAAIAKKNPVTSMITSRGCPFNCTFCSKIFKTPRFRSVGNIIEEMEQIQRKEKSKDIQFMDATFNLNHKMNKDLCLEMGKNQFDFNWRAICRPDLFNSELIQSYRKANCYILTIGAESGSDKVLKFIRKGYTTQHIKDSFRLVKKYNIESHALFMIGIPSETSQDIRKTFNIIQEIKPNYLQMSIYSPLPGTALYQLSQKMNWIKEDLEFYDCLNVENPILTLKNLPRKYIANMRKISYLRNYLSPFFLKSFGKMILSDIKRYPHNFKKMCDYYFN